MSNIKEIHGKPRLHVSVNLLFGVWPRPPCCDSVVIIAVLRMHPGAILLAMITMRKSTHEFPFLSYISMGLHLVALQAAGAPLLCTDFIIYTNLQGTLLLNKTFPVKNLL